MNRNVAVLSMLGACALGHAEITSFTSGAIRIQVLSPNLLRVEVKGPHGFEDRPTFRVQRRNWATPGTLTVTEDDKATVVRGDGWLFHLAKGATSLNDVTFKVGNDRAFHPTKGTSSVWLPPVGKTPSSWTFTDSPRLIPPAWGATPAPTYSPTSGWDTTNDSTDIYLFVPKGNYRTLRQDLVALTGRTEMPPQYMLGYIDSKWYPYTDREALDRVDQFRQHDIPLDVLVLDTDWRVNASFGYGVNTRYLPDIRGFFSKMHAKGVKVMFNDHPEPQTPTALDPKEMNYRWEGLSARLEEGLDVWWFDRNWSVSLREPMPGLRHEVWGMQVYRDMTQKAKPGLRPVMMANTDGIDNGIRNNPPDVAVHRFPVQWTGDTQPTWQYLENAIDNAVFSGVQAINPWVNDDLGGHTAMPTTDLYIRYMQYGALCPVMRPHCTYRLERAPWHFGDEAEGIVRDYAKLRYRLMPLLYTSAREAYDTGEPIVRRLDLRYPSFEEATRNDQFLLGDGLLVAPIYQDGRQKSLDAGLLHTADGKPGLLGEYFSNQELRGTPALTRVDKSADFDWGGGSPDKALPQDHFSVRWSGKVGPIPAGSPMKLAVSSDDGVRMWIDGQLVVDQWKPLNNVTNEADKVLEPGKTYDLKVEYYEESGGALCHLRGYRTDAATPERDVWIPPTTWTDVWTGKTVTGPKTIHVKAPLDQMPMFIKSGSVFALAPEMNHTGEKPWSTITLEAFVGGDGSTRIYEDDTRTVDYKTGSYRWTDINLKGNQLQIGGAQGTFMGSQQTRTFVVRFHTQSTVKPKYVLVDGTNVDYKWIESAAAFPLKGSGPATDGNVIEATIPMSWVTRPHTVELRY